MINTLLLSVLAIIISLGFYLSIRKHDSVIQKIEQKYISVLFSIPICFSASNKNIPGK